jgi:hypothetical protein
MGLSGGLSPSIGIVRLLFSFFKKDKNNFKRLEARLIMRGRVAELPEYIPFYISDETGNHYKGIYVVGLLIWNKGNQPIVSADFIAPLEIKVDESASIAGYRLIAIEDQTDYIIDMVDANTLGIEFDCINPNEYFVVPIFITGNPWVKVDIVGRIIGQSEPIDQTAEEVKASWGERIANLIGLLLIFNMIPGTLIGGLLIWKNYGISILWTSFESVPYYLQVPFLLGLFMSILFISSRIIYWIEKKKFPVGYPLASDLEPPLLQNIYGMLRTVFLAKKQRISTSIFNRGEPVLMPDKKIKRRSINDWIQ